MYTVIWQETGVNKWDGREVSIDRWDRFETKEEVKEHLAMLEASGSVCLGDVWIFPPQADDLAIEGDHF